MDTKTVRNAVLYAKDNARGTLREKVGAEFDRWLVGVQAQTLRDAAELLRADARGEHIYPGDLDAMAEQYEATAIANTA